MATDPQEYLKEVVRQMEKFKDAFGEKMKDIESRISKLEQK